MTHSRISAGGNFWDLAATGYKLKSSGADQAQQVLISYDFSF
jgi:hypothetical protein